MKKVLMFKFLACYFLGAVAVLLHSPADKVVALAAGIFMFVWSLE